MNRTTNICVNYAGKADPFIKARSGIPVLSHVEYTFLGKALAAKWLLANLKRVLRSGCDIYFRTWDDFGGNEVNLIKYFSKDPKRFRAEVSEYEETLREMATDPEEIEKDMVYVGG